MAPARNTAKAPNDAVISGLNGMASALAVYASSAGLLRTRRKTRFWLLAKLYPAGLVTRRVLTKGFRDASVHRFLPSQAFLAQAASPFFFHVTLDGTCLSSVLSWPKFSREFLPRW